MENQSDENKTIKYNWVCDIDEIVIPIHIKHEYVDSRYNEKLTDEQWYILNDVIQYMWNDVIFYQVKEILLKTIDIYENQVLKNERNENEH